MRPDAGPTPTRRELLAVGGSALVASLSGCLSGPLFGHPDVRESGATVERVVPWTTDEDFDGSAYRTLVVGERGGFHLSEKKPHQVWVWNETGERRAFTVEIAGDPGSSPWFSRTYEFAPNARLAIDLRTPRRYAITVEVGDRTKTAEVPASRFDCNESATDVIVREGEIETVGVKMNQGCRLL